jgi:hypothetical protein
MQRGLAVLCAPAMALCLLAGEALCEEVPEPLGRNFPKGFMIEGILAQQLYTIGEMQLSYVPAAAGVPHAVIGAKTRYVTVGLGIGFFRMADLVKPEGEDEDAEKERDIFTSMLFSPRLELTLYRSKRGVAEAYLAASFGAGFHQTDSKYEEYSGYEKKKSEDLVLGGHMALGARCYLSGSPFSIGAEFGWTGMYFRVRGKDPDYPYEKRTRWLNMSGAYAAFNGQFVFD